MMPGLKIYGKGVFSTRMHVSVWTIYILYIYTTNYMVNDKVKFLPTFFFLVPHIATFYTVLFLLHFQVRQKILWVIAVFFLAFPVLASASYVFFFFLLPQVGVTLYSKDDLINFIHSAGLSYIEFFAFALMYYYFASDAGKERELRIMAQKTASIEQEKITQERDNAILRENEMKIRKEKLEFEFAFLQSQINPHFLHNTLNVLFSQALKISPELAENISNMSEIIRYSMESVSYKVPVVSLQQELRHLQILIDINTMRFGKLCFIDYNIEGQAEDQLIPPLVLITVVENAFKYGDIRDSNNPLTIKVGLRPGHMHFYCRNKKLKLKPPSSHNIGIKNLRQRLDVLFKDRYRIETINEVEFYTFELTINSI